VLERVIQRFLQCVTVLKETLQFSTQNKKNRKWLAMHLLGNSLADKEIKLGEEEE